jgi:hypothetical protein
MDIEERSESRQKETKSRRLHGSQDTGRRRSSGIETLKPIGEPHSIAATQPENSGAPVPRPQFQAGDMRGIAEVAQRVSGDLRPQFPETADYLAGAAAGLKRLVDLFEEPSVARLTGEVRDLARTQPAFFVAGAMLAGFVLWRIFSTSTAGDAGGPSGTNR